jgi:hypothetical protein
MKLISDLRRFLQLPPADRRLVLRALWSVAAIRARLALRPFPDVDRATNREPIKPKLPPVGAVEPQRIAWAVRAVSRYVPGATCLTQALAARSLLAAEGKASRLQLGMARIDGRPQAHAWLESDGAIVIGGEGHTRFAPFKATSASPQP